VSHVTATMLPAFLTQYAAGCFLVVTVAAIRQSGWRYLRLIGVVSLALAATALLLICRETGWAPSGPHRTAVVGLAAGALLSIVWLFVNATQREAIRDSQRLWPAAAGLACLLAAIAQVLRPDVMLQIPGPAPGAWGSLGMSITTTLGALLLGSVTCAMLLGHRYLTDTDMPISPLRRLAKMYLAIFAARVLWVAAMSWPLWTGAFQPRDEGMWFWLMMCVRVGIGVVGLGVFAWMVWDCVKRRATQSATAIFYLSMIFAFLGELAGQYLTRTERLLL